MGENAIVIPLETMIDEVELVLRLGRKPMVEDPIFTITMKDFKCGSKYTLLARMDELVNPTSAKWVFDDLVNKIVEFRKTALDEEASWLGSPPMGYSSGDDEDEKRK